MSDPDVSVVMSVYNGEEYLADTLDSVLAQEGVEFEVIVINDGSTDQSGEILAEYLARDNRIRVLTQENEGLTSALIRGCVEARGELLARQDVGDRSSPEHFRLLKRALERDREIAFVSCWTSFYGPEWEYLYESRGTGVALTPMRITPSDDRRSLLDGPSHHSSVMMRREAYFSAGEYRREFFHAQDWDLWRRLAEVGTFLMVPKRLYHARILAGSISTTRRDIQFEFDRLSWQASLARRDGESENPFLVQASALQEVLESARGDHAPDDFVASYFVGEALRRNQDRRSLRYLSKAIRSRPWSLKAWLRGLQAIIGVFLAMDRASDYDDRRRE